ncbi:MAG: hypothetical protein HOF74_03765 [Gammaproteobacteria bacterium]|jgi:peptidyl-prolyl cis-trans isomerase A (cyclophilin A)|nr:hypothetical protein [Gammaproteobacteria bacterium]MBT3858923.1 hypothetical protein [Gammaproteobacteria bacterium]MBT3988251.1 hypothetical protein [Gammaproteobacteria bacterium]MBT4256887.1 hypothetical protein [Gammaproteobacteria bacterium]MBT4582521.1 hypothetical protein [Gammaproteobacteria bacterium]
MIVGLRRRQRKSVRLFAISCVLIALSSLSAQSYAGTIVRVSTSMGDYSIELLDDIAPITVQNFLNYVNRNDYNGTFLHRVVDGFVAQGGAYRFRPFSDLEVIASDAPIPNEFNVSNTRGTVAMAKLLGDPNSATNQWFVNIADNSENLDVNNEGFTVFGQVLGDGMAIVDAIDELPWFSPGSLVPNAPFYTDVFTPLGFVTINVEVMERFSSAPHVFESNTGLLITSVDVDSGSELISMNFNQIAAGDNVVFKANLESVISRRDSFDGIASYSSADQRLRIPSLEVNLNGSVSLVTNVVLVLSDQEASLFTLESYDQ